MSRLGIDGFEQLVPEGLPKAGAVLVLVPPVEEKDQIAAQFVLEGLRNSDAAIVLESEAGLRDLARRLGNVGVDADKAVAEGRLVLLDWSTAIAARNGIAAGIEAAKAALAAAASGTKVFPALRVVVDLSGALPDPIQSVATDAVPAALSESMTAAGALSLFFVPRTHGLPARLGEAFDVVLDLRPLKPSGLGLAVLAIGGTELPRSHMVLSSTEGRLVLEAPKRPSGASTSASVECPVCRSTIPAGAPECPVCKSPRPVRRPGEPEVLDYIEALGQRVGLPGAPLEEAPPPASEEAGREGPPARPEIERRGLTNGLARRRMAPPAPSPPPGRVNGLTSTIIAARRGMTNGLTNGNGFTNGLGSTRFASESRRGAWRVYLVPIVAVVLLATPLLLAPESALVNSFGIDGSFADWPARVSLAESPSLPAGIDLTSAAVREEADRLFGFVETRGPILEGSPDHLEADLLRAFVDLDGDAATGYRAEGIGAEVLVEIAGAQNRVTSARVSEFTGTDTGDWGGWQAFDNPVVAVGTGGDDARRLELSFLSPAGRNGAAVRVLFESSAYSGATDTSGFSLTPGVGTLVVEQASVAPDTVTGASAPLLELRVRATQGTALLDSLRLAASGTFPENALRTATLVDVASSSTLATADRYQNGFTLNLASPLALTASEQVLRVDVGVDPAQTGTLAVAVERDSDVHARDAAVYLSTLPVDRDRAYVGAAPPGAVIDGAFGEWSQAADDTLNEPTTGGNPDVDLAKYDAIRSGSTVAAYAKVAGRILHGVLAPAENPGVPQVAPLDSDRDSVPDAVEAPRGAVLPFDFNNDNVSDANSGGDRDGDGIADYPAGNDVWLNTTIPGWYPTPYGGRFVSVYIGPVQRPVTRGEDTLRVYIDSDATPGTGYAGPVGADWMVEIVGRGAIARTQGVYRFSGANPGQWAWTRQADVAFAIGTRQIELAATLPAAPVPGTTIAIDLRDWKGDFDVSGVATRGLTRSALGMSVDAGAYTASLPAGLGDPVQVRSDSFVAEWRLAEVAAGSTAGFTPLSLSSGDLTATESGATYGMQLGGAEAALEYAFGPDSIKEQLVVEAPPSPVSDVTALRVRFSFSLSAGASLMAVSGSPITRAYGDEGSLAVVVGGQTRARFPAPWAVDADGRTIPCSYALPAIDALDIVCPVDGLDHLAYPIAIDPSLTYALSNSGTFGTSGQILGWSVAAGDFNGDGYTDVLAGAPFNSKNGSFAGMAFIYLGPITGTVSSPNVALRGNGSSARAGFAVAAGDFNNDGFDDAAVGQQNGQPTLVFNGRTSWPPFVSTANSSFPVPLPNNDNSMGRTLTVGDFNADGNDDLVIGRPLYTDPANPHGRAYLIFGPFATYEPTADLTLIPFNNTSSRFSWALATGRIDSDSRDDLIVGEPTVKITTPAAFYGRISFFKGSSLTGSGTKSPDKTIINMVSNAWFGAAVAVGRLDTDSYADLVVGSPQYSTNAGRAYVFLARSDGTGLDQNQTVGYTFSSQSAGEKFGTSVLVMDYFGDGGNDVVVGAEAYNTDDGRVYVYNNPLTDQSVPDETLNAASASDDERFGHALAGGKGANDPLWLLIVGGPYWDDSGQSPATDWGRAVIASIPEFPDSALAAGLVGVLLVLLERRRRGGRNRRSMSVS